MTRYYLTRLSIEGFRGINNEGQPLELRFDPQKVNSIYAENGLGKSSIYDALSYAIHGEIPKLAQLEQTENAESYINNRFHSAKTATIELTFTPDDGSADVVVTVVRAPDGTRTATSATEPDPEEFLASLRSDFVLLDQDTFGRFIRDRSLERGRTFSRLLGLSRLSDFRTTLQKLAHSGNIENDFDLATLRANAKNWKQRQDQLLINLRKAYDTLTGEPYSGPFDAEQFSAGVISALKQSPTIEPFCEVEALGDIEFAKVEAAVSSAEKSADREKLLKLRAEEAELKKLAPLDGEADEQAGLKTAIDSRDAALELTAGPLIQTNYQAAVAVLESDEWADERQCPTCEAKQPSSLLETLQAKLRAYDDAKAAGVKIKSQWETGQWVKRFRDLEANELLKPSGDARDHGRLSPAFTGATATIEEYNEATAALNNLEASRVKALDNLASEIAALEESLPVSMVQVTNQLATAKQAATDLKDYEARRPKLAVAEYQIARREAWESFITTAYHDFGEAESTWVASRQKAIATDYQEMHDKITRNPDVVPSLDRPATSERLHLRLEHFYGLTDLSATTLLQESYCNAVAISTFLSTALLCPTRGRFVVLDDVTSSFDGGHQFNLMELLRTKIIPPAHINGVQVILLTHDTLLEKYLDKATHTGTWRHHKLTGRPPNHPVLTEQHNMNHVRQRAENFLNAGQTESGSIWIRPYMEATLLQIIRKVGIRVPLDFAIDDTRKMPQKALEAITGDIDLYDEAGTLVLTKQQLHDLTNTLVPSLISNYLAHYATGNFSGITSHVLLGVLGDIDSLADSFKYDCTCKQPGQTIRRFYRTLTAKDCNC